MNKSCLFILILLLVVTFAGFSQSEEYYEQGRLVLGGSGSFGYDFDYEEISVSLYPDIGFFAVNNLELLAGLDFRYLYEDLFLRVSSGLRYFVSGGIIVPYAGTMFYYTVLDDTWDNEGRMSINAVLGLDIFLIDSLAVFFELGSPSFVLEDGSEDFSTGIDIRFGYHFYVPAGPLEFSGS